MMKNKRMRRDIFFFLLFFFLPQAATAGNPVIISEVHITGGQGKSDDDFVELHNPNEAAADISGFRLRSRNSKGTENSIKVFDAGSCVPPGGYFLWANSKGVFAPLADTATGATLSSDYARLLCAPEKSGGALVDSLAWGKDAPLPNPLANQSLVRNRETLDWSLSSTPTPAGSSGCPPEDPEDIPSAPQDVSGIRINEILPDPEGDEGSQEFIELYSASEAPLDLSGFTLKDASKTGKYVFPSGSVLEPGRYLVIWRKDFSFALNNSNETVLLSDPAGNPIDRMAYTKTRAGVSLNFLDGSWRGGTPTPGAPNRYNALPETHEKVPRKGYVDIPVLFDARAEDPDEGKLNVVWDFGDGRKSYKEKTEHRYEKKGAYLVRLSVSDGQDETVEMFPLEIGTYDPPKLRLTAIAPNPEGKDSENEWLRVENKEKKSVNLKGFGIATGASSKKIVNHPIREDIVISPKSEITLTRETALFTLPNKKGRVELRAPNGETIDKVRYASAKNIEEGIVYVKDAEKRWSWQKGAASDAVRLAATEETQEESLEDSEESFTSAVLGVAAESPEMEPVLRIEIDPFRTKNPEALLSSGTGLKLPQGVSYQPEAAERVSDVEHAKSAPGSFLLEALNERLNALINRLETR